MPRLEPTRVLLAFFLGACASAPPVSVPPAAPGEAGPPPASPPMRPPRALDEDGIFYVVGADARHPRVRYLDGQVSLNTSCAIRLENKLSRRIPPVYVNGRPVGFC